MALESSTSGSDSMATRQALAVRKTLEETVLQIAAMASERTSHVPPIEFESRFSLFYKFELRLSAPQPAKSAGEAAAATPGKASDADATAEGSARPVGTRWLGDMANLLKNGPPMMLRGALGTS
jgi:hypothetical protein